MTSLPFQKDWEMSLGKKLSFRINNNRSTMLSIKWEPGCTKVSMHKMFLKAPEDVMNALEGYLKKKKKTLPLPVKAFIEENVRKLDFSKEIPLDRLNVEGRNYHLQEIYDQINQEYFQGRLSLRITWFGKKEQKNRSTMTFGLYYDPLRLVKIHKKLDHPKVPRHVIDFIVYHEMLHSICPSYYDESGMHRIHTKEFKEKEKCFRYYRQATRWIKDNQEKFFD